MPHLQMQQPALAGCPRTHTPATAFTILGKVKLLNISQHQLQQLALDTHSMTHRCETMQYHWSLARQDMQSLLQLASVGLAPQALPTLLRLHAHPCPCPVCSGRPLSDAYHTTPHHTHACVTQTNISAHLLRNPPASQILAPPPCTSLPSSMKWSKHRAKRRHGPARSSD